MPDVSFVNLLVVAAIAVLAPLTVGFAPRLRIPAVVLEIVGGIIVGPSGFGWVRVDLPVQILALFGLAFLLALLAVRGLPALLGLRANGTRPTLALGLLQATSLPFIVTATQIGVALGKLSSVTAAALVCAGLLSVLIFPLIALGLLRRNEPGPAAVPAATQPVPEPYLM